MTRLWVLVLVQAMVAAASLVVEIVAGRMLAPYVGMSLYTWTSIIAVVLAGFSAGHWAGGRLAEWPEARALRANGWAMLAAALTTAGAVLALRGSAAAVLPLVSDPVASIVLLTTAAFFLPSFFAGIPAPILTMIALNRHADRRGRAMGAMFAAGAWGAILGTLAAGFVFVSWLGSMGTLVFVTAVYVALALWSFLAAGGARGPALAALVPLGLGVWTLGQPDPCTVESRYFCIRVIDAAPGERVMVLDHLAHGIAVRDDPVRMLTPNGFMLEALPRLRMEGREGWSAFLIGGGSYSVPRAWAARGLPVAVTLAEIDPAVTQAAQDHFWFIPGTERIVHRDARRLLAQEDIRYDVILGDAFTDIAVPQHLITREFLELARSRLNPGGVYVMNVIDHMDNLAMLASVVATARQVWPSVEVWTDPAHDGSDTRRVFVLVAGEGPSSRTQLPQRPPLPGGAVRIAAASVDAIVAERGAVILTDDFAPVDRLLGDPGSG